MIVWHYGLHAVMSLSVTLQWVNVIVLLPVLLLIIYLTTVRFWSNLIVFSLGLARVGGFGLTFLWPWPHHSVAKTPHDCARFGAVQEIWH